MRYRIVIAAAIIGASFWSRSTLPVGLMGAALILTWRKGFRDANAPGVLTEDGLDQHLPAGAGVGSDGEDRQVPPCDA